MFQQAGLPGTALPTPLKRDLALGAIFGLIVSVGLVFWSTTSTSASRAPRTSNTTATSRCSERSRSVGRGRRVRLPMTIVSASRGSSDGGRAPLRDSVAEGEIRAGDRSDQAPFEEAYRVVRSNLLVSMADFKRPRVIVTSANAGEGKTVTCANLAVSFARAGQRVVLVDLDLRHPDAHRLSGAHNRFGVCDLLLGRRSSKTASSTCSCRASTPSRPRGSTSSAPAPRCAIPPSCWAPTGRR